MRNLIHFLLLLFLATPSSKLLADDYCEKNALPRAEAEAKECSQALKQFVAEAKECSQALDKSRAAEETLEEVVVDLKGQIANLANLQSACPYFSPSVLLGKFRVAADAGYIVIPLDNQTIPYGGNYPMSSCSNYGYCLIHLKYIRLLDHLEFSYKTRPKQGICPPEAAVSYQFKNRSSGVSTNVQPAVVQLYPNASTGSVCSYGDGFDLIANPLFNDIRSRAQPNDILEFKYVISNDSANPQVEQKIEIVFTGNSQQQELIRMESRQNRVPESWSGF